jgi:hypothetical protein
VSRSWQDGVIAPIAPMAAVNFFMDRTAANWKLELARLKSETGDCNTAVPIHALGAQTGTFEWSCQRASLKGRLLLAPPNDGKVQSITFDVVKPQP